MDMENNNTTFETASDNTTQNVTYNTNYATIQPTESTGLATASMIIGIISLVGFLVAAYSPLHIVGLILGIVHASKYKNNPEIKKKAVPGIIMNSITLGIAVITWVIIIVGIIVAASQGYSEYMY